MDDMDTSLLSYDGKGCCQRIALTSNFLINHEKFKSKKELESWADSKGWKVKKVKKTIEIERPINKI